MSNKDKIILDLFAGTGAWSKPYADAGYDVRLVTLPHYPLFEDVPGDVRIYEPPANVYGILAAPVCTEFSFAKTTAERDFESAMELVHAALRIIWKCRLNGSLKFWAMENPVGFLRQFLGKAPYKFEQWEFGDNGIKPTEIWGYFNFPKKTVTTQPDKKSLRKVCSITGPDRKAVRSITPAGFANAFYKANT